MRRHSLHPLQWVWVCLIVLHTSAGFCIGSTAWAGEPRHAAVNGAASKSVLVHYIPWFVCKSVRGEWGKHWTGNRRQFDLEKMDDDGLPQLASHYHPLIGPYDSADPAVIQCHLLQMKLAGIDGVIVDWYGLARHDDYPQSHQATEAIFAATARYGLKFAICFEDRTVKHLTAAGKLDADQVAGHLSNAFEWLELNWFSASHYFRIAGRPLLLDFGPIHVTDAETWQTAFDNLTSRPRFFVLSHHRNQVGADGGFTWIYPGVWGGQPASEVVSQRLNDEFKCYSDSPNEIIVSAFAGFDDAYDNGYPDIAYRDGRTLRETLDVCGSGPWPIIQLVTWNDFGEGTMIEPCHEFGYSLLEIVQDSCQHKIGDDSPYTAADLRLPEILYRQRKSHPSRLESIDKAAELLASGEIEAARILLQSLTEDSSAEESKRSCVRQRFAGSPSIQLASASIEEDKLFR